jgi:hypothetical protein
MSGQRPRLFLVDGSSYIYRAFFALPPLTGPHGLPTNAIYGFTTMLLKLLSEARPEYAAVVFDAPGRKFRDELYDNTKRTGRRCPAICRRRFPGSIASSSACACARSACRRRGGRRDRQHDRRVSVRRSSAWSSPATRT